MVEIGKYLTIFITLPIIVLCLLYLAAMMANAKRVTDECKHETTEQMNVTSMGNTANYYICNKCGKKLKESEFDGRISREK